MFRSAARRILHNVCVRCLASDATTSSENVLYGGDLEMNVMEGSLGTILFPKVKHPDRADKIMQVCPNTGETMTFREFQRISVGVARGLEERGVKMGDVVLVCSQNSIMMNAALMGIIWHGAVAAPISAISSPDVFRTIIRHIKPKFYMGEKPIIFTVRRMAKEIIGDVPRSNMVILQNTKESDSRNSNFYDFIRPERWEEYSTPKIASAKEDPAVIMRSSLDGVPKCAELTHRAFAFYLTRINQFYGHTLPDSVLLQVQKAIWMSGFNTLLLSCFFGSKMVVISEFNEQLVLNAIKEHKVSFFYIFPAKLWQLLKTPNIRSYDLSSCEHVHIVGSKMAIPVVDYAKEETGVTVSEVYSNTEIAGPITDPLLGVKRGSAGRLIPGIWAKIYSSGRDMNLGPNKVGELCIKGPAIMKGYTNDKSTKIKIDKDGFLHTHDVGSYDEEGYLQILGAKQYLFKINDQLISPMEIEQSLLTRQDVKDVAIGPIKHDVLGKVMVAFVVKRKETVGAEELIQHVADNFPEPKRLHAVVFIPKIPRMKDASSINRAMMATILKKFKYKSE